MTDGNKIDALVLSAASGEWQKTALLISKVFDDPAFSTEKDTAQSVAERIYTLVDDGKLEANGNVRRWRDSNVRLVGDAEKVVYYD